MIEDSVHISNEFKSPNYDLREEGASIEYIVLHYTELLFDEALYKLCDPEAKVSAHYLIHEDGRIFNLVDDHMRAWHAGQSCWQGKEALNNYSIGIEIDNLGVGPFSEAQMKSCVELCKFLVKKHGINQENVIGHSDIAPNRKLDPGIYFDWQMLAREGLGIIAAQEGHVSTLQETSVESIQRRLARIGYNVVTTGIWDEQTNGVVRAFQSHFCQSLLKERGMELYRDLESKYSWDTFCEEVLSSILIKS